MPRAKTKAKPAIAAWWLSAGDEECPHCGQLYIYELEFRCPDCDSPCCVHCRTLHPEQRQVCPECYAGCDQANMGAHHDG